MRKIIGIVLAALVLTSCSVEDEWNEPTITVFEDVNAYYADLDACHYGINPDEIDTKTLVKMYNNDTDKVKSITRATADRARSKPNTLQVTKIDFGKDDVYIECSSISLVTGNGHKQVVDHHIWLYKN